jgi:uncharacterized membrane protein YoaK (UPF0700 family)
VRPGHDDSAVSPAGLRLLSDPAHGPLSAMLLVLTVVAGVVDAVSILRLGRVFVANMTGNVVFIGFSLAGAPGFVLTASLFALAGFLAGAALGGAMSTRLGSDRALVVRAGAIVELVLLAGALVVSAAAGAHLGRVVVDVLAATSALAMGVQTAVVRRLAVADLNTTVLTMTLTGIAADLRTGHRGPMLARRVLAVLAMLAGAVAGAELVLHVGATAGLGLAVGLLAVVAAGALAAARRPGEWRSP